LTQSTLPEPSSLSSTMFTALILFVSLALASGDATVSNCDTVSQSASIDESCYAELGSQNDELKREIEDGDYEYDHYDDDGEYEPYQKKLTVENEVLPYEAIDEEDIPESQKDLKRMLMKDYYSQEPLELKKNRHETMRRQALKYGAMRPKRSIDDEEEQSFDGEEERNMGNPKKEQDNRRYFEMLKRTYLQIRPDYTFQSFVIRFGRSPLFHLFADGTFPMKWIPDEILRFIRHEPRGGRALAATKSKHWQDLDNRIRRIVKEKIAHPEEEKEITNSLLRLCFRTTCSDEEILALLRRHRGGRALASSPEKQFWNGYDLDDAIKDMLSRLSGIEKVDQLVLEKNLLQMSSNHEAFVDPDIVNFLIRYTRGCFRTPCTNEEIVPLLPPSMSYQAFLEATTRRRRSPGPSRFRKHPRKSRSTSLGDAEITDQEAKDFRKVMAMLRQIYDEEKELAARKEFNSEKGFEE